MKTIPLTRGYFAFVDDGDYERLTAAGSWHAAIDKDAHRQRVYARRNIRINGKRTQVSMHNLIMGTSEIVDHVDTNGCNNQKYNLRRATNQQNCFNRRKRPGSSQFKGVTWNKRLSKWVAAIGFAGQSYHIGFFRDEADAATAYNFKAFELFGEFARFNTPEMPQ